MSYGLTLYTAATGTVLTLDEAKRQCGVALDSSYFDASLIAIIKAATDWAERRLNRQLLTATWDLQIDSFPLGKILIPRAPLRSVTSITYLESAAGASTTLDAADYRVVTSREPGEVTAAFGTAWPSVYPVNGAVTIRFSAGYGAATAVPEQIKEGIKAKVTELYRMSAGEDAKGYEDLAINLLRTYEIGDEFLSYSAECVYGAA